MRLRVPGIGRVREAARVRSRDRGIRLLRPEEVASAWMGAVRDLPITGSTSSRRAERLLILGKVGGTEDVLTTLSGRGLLPIRAAELPRREVKVVYRALVGPLNARLTDTDYRIDDPELVEPKARYRAFLRPVMNLLRDELGLAGVVGANFSYRSERELAAACEDIDLPFLVLHKESIRSPRQRSAFTRAYRDLTGPFGGRSMAVYNKDEAESQTEAGVVRGATVVGCPRIDALHAWRREGRGRTEASEGPAVLLAVDPAAGTWTPYDGSIDLGAPRWEALARETEEAFLAAARRMPGRRFVIKAKVGHGEQLALRLPAGLPPNVSVVTDGTATELLLHATVIVGFNTTVLAEGLAVGCPVVVPAFAEAAEPGAEEWAYPLGDAVIRARRPEELTDAVLAAMEDPAPERVEPSEAVRVVLDRLVGNDDGAAGQRTWDWFSQHLSPLRRG